MSPAFSPPSAIESYELLFHAKRQHARLMAAPDLLETKPGCVAERAWLTAASALLTPSDRGLDDLLERALNLRELAALRADLADERRESWVDTLERLVAGITFHAGARSPLIEALFPKLKLAALRRSAQDAVETYSAEFEKRLQMSYVKRMLSEPELAFIEPVIAQVRESFGRYQESFSGAYLAEPEASKLSKDLSRAAMELELPLRQARLLAEAALAPVDGAFEASQLGSKPRKRTGMVAASVTETAEEFEPEAAPAPRTIEASEPAAAPSPAPSPRKGKKSAASNGEQAASVAPRKRAPRGAAPPSPEIPSVEQGAVAASDEASAASERSSQRGVPTA